MTGNYRGAEPDALSWKWRRMRVEQGDSALERAETLADEGGPMLDAIAWAQVAQAHYLAANVRSGRPTPDQV